MRCGAERGSASSAQTARRQQLLQLGTRGTCGLWKSHTSRGGHLYTKCTFIKYMNDVKKLHLLWVWLLCGVSVCRYRATKSCTNPHGYGLGVRLRAPLLLYHAGACTSHALTTHTPNHHHHGAWAMGPCAPTTKRRTIPALVESAEGQESPQVCPKATRVLQHVAQSLTASIPPTRSPELAST